MFQLIFYLIEKIKRLTKWGKPFKLEDLSVRRVAKQAVVPSGSCG